MFGKINLPQSIVLRKAFTLAEVLITLAIIGVVAALTIPTLISNYKSKELETRYKKAKAILVNGFKLLMAKEDVYDVSRLSVAKCGDDKKCYANELKNVFRIAQDNTARDLELPEKYTINENNAVSYIPPAYASEDSPFNWDDVPYIFQVQDGVTYGVEFDPDNKWINVYTDVNGAIPPNTTGRDMFKFTVAGTGTIADMTSDLEQVAECSLENLSGCNTFEKCDFVAEARCEAGHNVVGTDSNSYRCSQSYGSGLCFINGACVKTISFGNYCS